MKNCNLLALNILVNAGLKENLGYYQKVGVDRDVLNEVTLLSIFNDLVMLDTRYALEFVKLVSRLETLGAYDFSINFLRFGYNDFSCEGLKVVDCLSRKINTTPGYDAILDDNSDLIKSIRSKDIQTKFLKCVNAYSEFATNQMMTNIKK